jgi:hypothetical protein
MSGATDSSRPMVAFGRSGGENLCSQPKYSIDYNLMNRTILRPVGKPIMVDGASREA